MGSTRIILSSAPSSGAVVAVGSPCFIDAAVFWAVLATSCPVCFTFLADCCARSLTVLPVCCALPAACCAASFTVLAVWERQKATCCPACCSCSCSGRALRSSSYERRATPHDHQKRGYLLGKSLLSAVAVVSTADWKAWKGTEDSCEQCSEGTAV